jgi:serine phosphatase RsbU (regulator of sigma subunit)
MFADHVNTAAATRPYPGELVNGDAWRIDRCDERLRIAVIDGLGHGPAAADAARAALSIMEEHPALDLAQTLESCHRALRGTRGAAIGLALIDPPLQRLLFAGVGNVEARLWQAGQETRFSSARGIVGVTLPRIRLDERAIQEAWRLVIHTDGVSARFRLSDLLEAHDTLEDLSDAILTGWGRATDDVTVVVAAGDP